MLPAVPHDSFQRCAGVDSLIRCGGLQGGVTPIVTACSYNALIDYISADICVEVGSYNALIDYISADIYVEVGRHFISGADFHSTFDLAQALPIL